MKELSLEYPAELGPLLIDLCVKVGQRITAGEVIAFVETEKATQELEAFESFTILKIQRTERGYIL